jgi:hypothetical protein
VAEADAVRREIGYPQPEISTSREYIMHCQKCILATLPPGLNSLNTIA